MESIVSGVTAALLTLFDLDRTFYIPGKVQQKAALYAWWWGFIVTNGILAAVLYDIVSDAQTLASLEPTLKAVVVGISYLALIRLKFTTFHYQGKEVPFGLEAFYEAGKGYAFKRINRIAKEARFLETTQLAQGKELPDLLAQAKLSVEQDQLLTPEEKRSRKEWLLKVAQDSSTPDAEKKAAVADYILSGQRSSDIA
jgi:hypothetical protein